MSDADSVLKRIRDEEIPYVDLRFTDPRGKWQHLTLSQRMVDEDMFTDGVMFDGSSIAGWKVINESDMTLMPDPESMVMDPFEAQPTLIMNCDIHEPSTGQDYERDPRSLARRAEAYLQYTGIGDTAFFGPELEFFVFDSVRFSTESHSMGYQIDAEEGPYNDNTEYEGAGNLAHRPRQKGGYFPVPPLDSLSDMRSEMLSTMAEMGIPIDKHHHEVAPAQHELGMTFDTLLKCADNVQIYKYVVHRVAHSYGKTATFMPKPVMYDNGSGMHVHQSIWMDNEPLFAGNRYADLSEMALYYIGGIIRHAKAINAFTNASTNSYKRLVPGYEAPVLLAYSSRNRSASCRIPYATSPKGKRVEIRFPDPTANPYLAFSAMLMAGLDGIENRIHPGDAMDKNLYDLPPEELKDVPTVSASLREALDALASSNDFLKRGEVFSDELINGYLELKWEEVMAFETTTHPIEFDMYYSV